MALFKVLRGDESNLPVFMNDGWAYFCSDTGNFYIDHMNSSGALVRTQLNASCANKIRYKNGGSYVEIDASNIASAIQDIDSHTGNSIVHITSDERMNWDTAKTHADSAHAPSNAEKNQNAFSNVKVGSTTIAADTSTDTLEFVGNNVTLTADETNDIITISVAEGSTSAKGVVQLTNSTSSTSTTTAATPNSVKSAYDLANTAKTTADSKADASHLHIVSQISDLTATATELNYVNGVTSNIQTQLNGKANSSHGTHVTFTTTTPEEAGTASAGTATTVSHSDHVHPAQTSVTGNAGTATKLESTRYIDGVSFNGSTNATRYASCSTVSSTAAKTASIESGIFNLITGARVTVKFSNANTASNPTLNVGNTGAKYIYWHGTYLRASQYWEAGSVLDFVYNGSQWELIGVAKDNIGNYTLPTASSSTLGGVTTTSTVAETTGLTACPIISGVPYYKDTNTTYSLSSFGVTATAAELNALDGITATVTELNYVDGVTSNIQTQLNNKASSSHGNHVPSTETANNARFLRNDNTWNNVTPSNIGALGNSGDQTLDGSLTINKNIDIKDTSNSGYRLGITRTANSVDYQVLMSPTTSCSNLYYYQGSTLVNAMQLYPTYTSFRQPVAIAAGGTGANSAAKALENLGGISITKVWENASPTSNFAAQTVSISLSGYSGVMVTGKFQYNGTDVRATTGFIPLGQSGHIMVANLTNTNLRYRLFTVSSTGVTFQTGINMGTGAESAGNAIPTAIYGVKGVS